MIKTCAVCGNEFETKNCSKYCPDCRDEARAKVKAECTRRYLKNRRAQRPKLVDKPVEKLRPLTKDDLHRLLTLIRDAYQAGWLILQFGGQSALTDDQLAAVEQKYPDHLQTLGDKRNQKFFDAVDKFIQSYREYKGGNQRD